MNSIELLAVFARDAKKTLPIIGSIFENIAEAESEDLNLFKISVHSMKSALVNIGEREASKQAALLEAAAKSQDKNAIKENARSFIEIISAIIAKADAQGCCAALADEDPAYFKEQLQIIGNACATYDERAADAAIAALKKKSWTKESKDLIDKISEYLLFSDFEAVQKAVSSATHSPLEVI